jgi:HB1, ASXL, restriction endonuclease HTH domain
MTAKQNLPKKDWRTERNYDAGMAMQQTRAAKDLAIGDIIQVESLEDDQVVRKTKRIRKGLDAGLLHITLVARDGDQERIALGPEERVTFVGKAPEAGKGPSGRQAKGTAKAKGGPEPDAVAVPAPEAAKTPASSGEPLPSNSRDPQKASVVKKMSCLDAAAKLLTETGQPMTCQELIAAIAAAGYWTSPAGKTPQATLYAAIVREMRTKKDRARFRKTAPGRFALA